MMVMSQDLESLPAQGFNFSYRVGDFCVSHSFGDGPCRDVVVNMMQFLMGCGYMPSTVIASFLDVCDEMTAVYGSPLAEIVDPTSSDS